MLPAKLTSYKRDFTVLGGGGREGGGILLNSLWMLLGSESCCLFESSSLSSLAHCVCVCVRVMEYPSHLFLPSSHTNFISCSLLTRDGANAQFEKGMSSHIKEANAQIICLYTHINHCFRLTIEMLAMSL